LTLTLCTGLWVWFLDRGADSPLRPADAPAWARFRDYLLEGPDAGAWASNASALWLGRLDDLDAHRLPTLPRITVALMHLYPDPALAGHLANHLLHLLVGPVVYLLGRAWMGRGMALGAALATLLYGPGAAAAERYGVDPLVTFAVPAALLAAEVAARRWWLGAPAGMVVGAAAASHLTTLGLPIPALLLCLLRGAPGWRRWLGSLALVAGILLGGGGVFYDYPRLQGELFRQTLAEGVSPSQPTASQQALSSSMDRAVAIVRDGGARAVETAVRYAATTTRPRWLPWTPALILPWLGILGFGLASGPRRAPRPGWLRRVAYERVMPVVRGLGVGIPLALALAPVLAFAAAGSPARYSDNFYPLVALLMFRGGDVILRAGERLAHRLWRGWPIGLGGLVVAAAVVKGLWNPSFFLAPLRMPPPMDAAVDWELGALVRAHFPAGGGASCTRREVVAYAGRVYCPYSSGMFYAAAADPYREQLDKECPGEGDIPYVIVDAARDDRGDARRAMDTWVEGQGTPLETLVRPTYRARVYGVSRLAASGAGAPATPASGSAPARP
jgi:hypothetical protein